MAAGDQAKQGTSSAYSTGESQAFQLIVLAVFGAVYEQLAYCMLVHFFIVFYYVLHIP